MESAGWVTAHCCAALPKCRVRATASKYLNCLSDIIDQFFLSRDIIITIRPDRQPLLASGGTINRGSEPMSKNPILTTSSGAPVADNQNSITAGPMGPVLLQDFHLLEKLAHQNRERIP